MRLAVVLAVFALFGAGCGAGGTTTTEPSQFPTGSVRSWLNSLEAGDSAAALELTFEESMLVVLAAENDMPAEVIGPLLRRGATEESAAAYISEFTEALRTRYGGSLADVTVDGFEQLDGIYAAVTVTGDSGASIITRRAPGGLWQIDLVGTLGPALITQLRDLLESAPADEDGNTIRAVYESGVVPSLEAASASDPENLALASQIRAIKGVLNSG